MRAVIQRVSSASVTIGGQVKSRDMHVSLVNDGPVTLLIDTRTRE
jgi:D-Tyr-tRNAtyr deacylase